MNPEVRACGLDKAIGDSAQRYENRPHSFTTAKPVAMS
jgi:hypothetical protein